MDVEISTEFEPTMQLRLFHEEADLQRGLGQLVRCEKRRRVAKESLPNCCLVSEKWQNLDSNILREIFSRVPILDLFLNVSSVCLSWEAACWDFMFWSHNKLDLSATGAGIGMVDLLDESVAKSNRAPGFFGGLESPEKYNQMAIILMRKLRHIMEGQNIYGYSMLRWRLSIQTIILPYDLEISDTHLLYIAKRTPCLKQILLLGVSRITVPGFIKAIRNWKHVKEIHLGPRNDDQSLRFIKEIGRNCRELEVLHVHQTGFLINEENALVIARFLPRLKKLEVERGFIFVPGVETFFKICLQLEEVYFNKCRKVLHYKAQPRMDDIALGPESFRLSWTADEQGYPKWEVKPLSTHDVATMEPEDYEGLRIIMQSQFDWLMFNYRFDPRRSSVAMLY